MKIQHLIHHKKKMKLREKVMNVTYCLSKVSILRVLCSILVIMASALSASTNPSDPAIQIRVIFFAAFASASIFPKKMFLFSFPSASIFTRKCFSYLNICIFFLSNSYFLRLFSNNFSPPLLNKHIY